MSRIYKLALYIICIYVIICSGTPRDQCKSPQLHALILARGGSKGMHKKNLVTLNGTSLLGRTISTIRKTRQFHQIWVSTDCDEIADEATKYGALVFRRAEIYAQDNTTSIEAVKEFLRAHNTIYEFALFQCTSVFQQTHYITEAVKLYRRHECVFAVTKSHKLRWQRYLDGKVLPLNFDQNNRPRRQDWAGEFVENGMFYFANRVLVLQHGQFQNERCGIVEVDASDALEIDGPNDVLLSQCLIAMKIKY